MYLSILFMFFLSWSAPSQQPDPKEILEKHFLAYKQSQWDALETVTATGKLDIAGKKWSMRMKARYPDMTRVETARMISGTNGGDYWKLDRDVDPRKAITQELGDRVFQANVFSFGSPLAQDQLDLSFLGMMDKEGSLYFVFEWQGEGRKTKFYIDRKNYLMAFQEILWTANANDVFKITYEGYRTFGPFQIPIAINFESKDLNYSVVYDDFLIGDYVNPRLFDRPKSQE